VKKPKEAKLWKQLGSKRISAIPDIAKIGEFYPDRYDSTSWERVAYSDIWAAHIHLTNSLMMSSVEIPELLELASKYCRKIFVKYVREFLKISK